ncbi:MAG: DUF1501 domain-containing protein [Planctomycetia bacterium]|nr:DUF1501 domain-containing protein [Planctomycetia bacterium]
MLTIRGSPARFCDRVSRRNFLAIGSLALGSFSLADLLRTETLAAEASPRKSPARHKSVIMVFLPGGPSHIDICDLKPAAPSEIRGPFRPIATRVPGVELCEHLPRLAATADKLAVVRALVGGPDDHACHMCLTGWARQGPQPSGGWPTFGSVVSKLSGAVDPAVPPYVSLAAPMIHPPYNDPGPGFLGVAHSAFRPDEEGKANMVLRGVTLDRLADRKSLLTGFDRIERAAAHRAFAGLDAFHAQAFEILTSPKIRDALDISREDPFVVARYGPGTPELIPAFNAAPRLTQQFLIARRLVEAGARVVTLAFGAYDWHEKNFAGLAGQLPYLDEGLSALIEDLHERGLARDVAVCVWGEFGRSPRINGAAGRDHWPAVSSAFLAGGGFRTGQAIGVTDRLGGAPKDRPVHFQEVLATLYHHLGLDMGRTVLDDFSGRPQYLVGDHQPLPELV